MTGKRDKPSIRHTPDGWTVRIPGYGLNRDTVQSFPSHAAAGRWLTNATSTGCDGTSTERSNHRQDAIAPVPAWEPYYYRYPYRF